MTTAERSTRKTRRLAVAVALTWASHSCGAAAFSPGRPPSAAAVKSRPSFVDQHRSSYAVAEATRPRRRTPSFSPMIATTSRTALFAADAEDQTRATDPGSKSKNGAATAGVEEENLSDVDARVLQSILEEGKVDARTEEGLKKMLERGTAPKQADPVKKRRTDEDDGEFSSAVFKAISDTKLWNSLSAKASELVESAKILIENRIERDSKLLASVGIFAWERAKRDVSRALPASGTSGSAVGRAVRTASRMLAANSSFVEFVPDENVALPPDSEGLGGGVAGAANASAYDQLNTPMDEIKSVTESIRDILAGKGQPVSPDGSGGEMKPRRGLRSVAPAGTTNLGERQRRAYDRRKATVLKREKEGIDRKFGRAVGAATDAAYELQRDLKVETNKPGYKAREVRRSIEGSVVGKALLGGKNVEALPEGEKEGVFGRFFGRSKEKQDERVAEQGLQLEAGASATGEVEVAPSDVEVQQPKKNAMDATTAAFDSYYREAGGADTIDAEIVSSGAAESVTDTDFDFEMDDAIFTEDDEENFEVEIDLDSIQVENLPPEPIPPLPPLIIEDMAYERARLGAVLRACLEAPDQTWLIPDVIPDASPDGDEGDTDAVFSVTDVDALREVITAMVCARDDLEVPAEEDEENGPSPEQPSMESMLDELRRLKGMADSIAALASRAAGMGAAERLDAELVGEIDIDWEDEDATPSLLGKLDDLAVEVASFDANVDRYESDFAAWEVECREVRDVAIEAAREAARAERAEERRAARDTARMAFEDAMMKQQKAEEEEEAAVKEAEAAEAARMNSAFAGEVIPEVIIEDGGGGTEKRGGMGGMFGGAFGMFAKREVDDDADSVTDGKSKFEAVTAEFADTFIDLDDDAPISGADPMTDESSKAVEAVTVEVVDAQVTQVEMHEQDSFEDFAQPTIGSSAGASTGSGSAAAAVEIVSDDEFNTAFGRDDEEGVAPEQEMKTAVAAEEEKEEAEDPLVLKVILRTLDVLFFVTEKTVFVGLPAFFNAGSTVSARLGEIQKEGMGSEGWTILHNVKDGSKRY